MAHRPGKLLLSAGAALAFTALGFKCPGDRPSFGDDPLPIPGVGGGGAGGDGGATSTGGGGGAGPSTGGSGGAPPNVCDLYCGHLETCFGSPDPMCDMFCGELFGDCPAGTYEVVESCIVADTACEGPEPCLLQNLPCFDVRYRCEFEFCNTLAFCDATLDLSVCIDACVDAIVDCPEPQAFSARNCIEFWADGCSGDIVSEVDTCTESISCIAADERPSTWN